MGLYLPGFQGRIGKIERHIRVVEFIGRGDAVTLVEYPVWMDGFPVGQIVVCMAVSSYLRPALATTAVSGEERERRCGSTAM
jgi:hypothetical protein